MRRRHWSAGLAGVVALGVAQAAPSIVRIQGGLNVSQTIARSFVSFSIELSSFPDFAGNLSSPNSFSLNLLDNIGNLTGSKPIIRVGGNTQDYALYDANLETATNGIYTNASADYPTILTIGDSFFESYLTWPDVQYIHGFNMASNTTAGEDTLVETGILACDALANGRFYAFEMGNEPDLYKTSAQGIRRSSNWNESDYVAEWDDKTELVKSVLDDNCSAYYTWIAPSFAGVSNSLSPVGVWQNGLGRDNDIREVSSHNYIDGATSPGVTLQGTLMNHTRIVESVAGQLELASILTQLGIPFVLGEANSLYNEGAPGLSETFGAALWGIDFNLWCAANNIERVHMHQGTNYRYNAWQPVTTDKVTQGTKAPYYGSIGTAAVLGNSVVHDVEIANIRLSDDREAAYVVFEDGKLARMAVINMMQYNYTNADGTINTTPRPSSTYSFTFGNVGETSVRIQRLIANGSDSVTGITMDGRSYNYELDQGRPVMLSNVTTGERAAILSNGTIAFDVPWSSMGILTFMEA